MKDLAIRISSALIGLLLFFIVIFADRPVLDIALGAVILFMLFELFNAFKFGITLMLLGLLGSAALLLSFSCASYFVLQFILVIYIAALAMVAVFGHNKISITDIFTMLFCTLYITFFTSFVSRIREIGDYGLSYVLLIFGCAWFSDTGAYFAGRFFGKHKLVPQISPKKTVEGSIGGIVTAAFGITLVGIFSQLIAGSSPNYLLLVPIGVVGSCLAQLGDLVASLIKRTCGVKDFGNVIPGHGGVLDRFDSVILVSPFIYFVCTYCISIGLPVF